MSRYIDIETIKPRQYENSEVELGALAYDYDEVNAMPFLDIVPCKECKHHFYDESNDCKMCYIHEYGEIWEDDDYCSHGEREDE